MEDNKITPIGYIKTDFNDKFGIPRQSGRIKELKGEIYFYGEYKNPDYFKGLDEFSHVWVLFEFNKSKTTKSATVRPPRLGGNERKGVFATRSPFRPNGIGLSSLKLNKITFDEKNGTVLHVQGVDIVNDTPIYDIKPYIPYTDCHPFAKGSFSSKNKNHRLKVKGGKGVKLKLKKDYKTVKKCIADDPRPAYQNSEKVYGFLYKDYDVKFTVKGKTAIISDVVKK